LAAIRIGDRQATPPTSRSRCGCWKQVSPDVVTLDIEMPVLGGLATMQAVRDKRCRIPVIMFSALTEACR
jgi:two-component system chemotaxis response regulator CheB